MVVKLFPLLSDHHPLPHLDKPSESSPSVGKRVIFIPWKNPFNSWIHECKRRVTIGNNQRGDGPKLLGEKIVSTLKIKNYWLCKEISPEEHSEEICKQIPLAPPAGLYLPLEIAINLPGKEDRMGGIPNASLQCFLRIGSSKHGTAFSVPSGVSPPPEISVRHKKGSV